MTELFAAATHTVRYDKIVWPFTQSMRVMFVFFFFSNGFIDMVLVQFQVPKEKSIGSD